MRGRGHSLESTVGLEPTFSVAETARHLGCGHTKVSELIALGLRYRASLHPTKGGLWPTFKVSHKNRRVALSAIDRHKRHMARQAGEPEPPPTLTAAAA